MSNIQVIPFADQSVAGILVPVSWNHMQVNVEKGNRIFSQNLENAAAQRHTGRLTVTGRLSTIVRVQIFLFFI